MYSLSKCVGVGVVTFVCGFVLATTALAADRAVYDKPAVEVPGTRFMERS